LPKTLLFENFNIDDLARYFVEKHEATLAAGSPGAWRERSFTAAARVGRNLPRPGSA